MHQLDDVLTIPTALLLVAIYIVSFAVRRLVEAIWPELDQKTPVTRAERIWEEFVLPTMPAFLGVVFCLAVPPRLFPYPAVAAATVVSRVLYGLGTGWFASWGYRMIKSVLQKRWNVPFPDDTPVLPVAAPMEPPTRPEQLP